MHKLNDTGRGPEPHRQASLRSERGVARMNWGAFDLNLLIVFDAVMQERSVTRAGGRNGLSQPAVSHALGRLRYMLKDELFIRTPDGMIPTPRAARRASAPGVERHAACAGTRDVRPERGKQA